MASTEVVVFPKTLVHVAQPESRRERRVRERRERRKFIGVLALAGSFTFGSALIALVWTNRPPIEAAAQTVETTTSVPLAPEFQPSTTYPTPETVPETTVPGWQKVRVQTPGWDDLGVLVTDGVHAGRDNRVLPGDRGVSVIYVDTDPTAAASVVVNGVKWRVYETGKVPANDISRFFRRPDVPVVVLISTAPGDTRPYVETMQ